MKGAGASCSGLMTVSHRGGTACFSGRGAAPRARAARSGARPAPAAAARRAAAAPAPQRPRASVAAAPDSYDGYDSGPATAESSYEDAYQVGSLLFAAGVCHGLCLLPATHRDAVLWHGRLGGRDGGRRGRWGGGTQAGSGQEGHPPAAPAARQQPACAPPTRNLAAPPRPALSLGPGRFQVHAEERDGGLLRAAGGERV